MATREQVQELVDQGKDFYEIGRILGITPGEAHLIATGAPADGSQSDQPPQQRFSNPIPENPTQSKDAEEMVEQRVARDEPMHQAKVEQSYEENIEKATTPSLFERIKSRLFS